jgi:hypothetical protein
MSSSLEIKRFNPKTMRDGSVSVMIARRGSGKSVLIKDIMYHKKHMSGIVFSGTEAGNSYFGKFVPSVFVYDEFNPDALQRLVDRQRKLKKEGNADPVFVVMDDCAFDRKFMNSKLLREISFNGRHYSICMILSSQWAMDMPPSLRGNIDYVFILRDNLYRERLWRNFFPFVQSLEIFNRIMDVCTDDYGCLVLDNTGSSSEIFHYKANMNREFRMGPPSYWGFNKQRFNPKYDDDDDDSKDKKKKGGTIAIKVIRK